MEEAAHHIGLKPSESVSAEDKLCALETGENKPTRKQLEKIASVYKRPLLTFYMKSPPARADSGEDFRQSSNKLTKRENALLDALLRDVKARQEMLKELLEDEEGFTPHNYVSSIKISDGVSSAVQAIASIFKFDHKSRIDRKGTPDDLFKALRQKAETAGIFVLLIGDLGSHHSAIGPSVFRGFAIADKAAPLIVINDQDAKSARSFTLIHEVTHILLGQTGVSGTPDIAKPNTSREVAERFCNDVAGEFLLPTEELGQKPAALENSSKTTAMDVINGIADTWSVSEPMVAYRLNRIGWLPSQLYKEIIREYTVRWLSSRKEPQKNDTGPSYYVVRRHRLGDAIIEVVRRTLRENTLSHTKAAKVLGVKAGVVEPLIRRYESSKGEYLHDIRR